MKINRLIKLVIKELVPPLLLKPFLKPRIDFPMDLSAKRMDAFYSQLLPPNTLCFDIGANVGSRVASFRRLHHQVVAVEPQAACLKVLEAKFGNDPQVAIIRTAVGSATGQAIMHLSDANTLSSLSTEFIDATTRSGRFQQMRWDKTESVLVTTLDALIANHGLPGFIKIDVEGYEFEVVKGLSTLVPLIALEWTPEMTDNLIACIERLSTLGPVSFNLSWGESQRMSHEKWMPKVQLISIMELFREETELFADIYVRSDVIGSYSPVAEPENAVDVMASSH